MTTPTLDAEPDCARPARSLVAERRSFESIPRDAWDRLAALNPWATPFSSWGFQRAWWDAYGDNAHDQTLVVVDPDADPGSNCADLVAIAPLMHRHVVEASDEQTHTSIRHGSAVELTPVAPTAKAVYFGATYHADYATLLADPLDLPEVAEAIVEALRGHATPDPDHPAPWDVVDLRRLRAGDPTGDALATAFGRHEIGEGWTLNLEREDVCPVTTLPVTKPAAAPPSIDDVLAALDKADRHEIRRKVRRAEAAGPVELVESTDPQADLGAFIELHQARWGADGLFPATRGGDQSRTFVHRLFELMPDRSGRGSLGSVHLTFLTVDGRRIGAAIHFETADSLLYYNAGLDPEARHLSPGVVLVERLVRRALERGHRRLDFLRGDEPYKYEWGARDEAIQRLLVRRTAVRGPVGGAAAR
ncbi:MAG TPA: GNAT family N-acetyltransferase [Candidatus Binatus sp.]|nr:GNAT family N-acetyltransferase [Candidatus Binatus sp.]